MLARIVIVEDDYLQRDWMCSELKSRFPHAAIDAIENERAFRSAIDGMLQRPPDVVVIDMMLQWAEAAPDAEAPPSDARDRFRAGFRCERLLREHRETAAVPIVLYTVLERADLQREINAVGSDRTVFIEKDADLTALFGILTNIDTPPAGG